MDDQIVRACVDLARLASEKNPRKDPRFYAKTFLAKFFDIYQKPAYPQANSISDLHQLWAMYRPGLESREIDKANLLSLWLAKINIPLSSYQILQKVDVVRSRRKLQQQAASEKGIRYFFTDEFSEVIKEVLELEAANFKSEYSKEFQKLIDACINATKNAWVAFNSEIHLKSDLPLTEKVWMFFLVMLEAYKEGFPFLLKMPGENLFMFFSTGLLEANTHSKNEMNIALNDCAIKLRELSKN